MSMRKNSNRVIALLLTLVMLLSVLPMGVFAAEGETVKGEPTVVDANGALALQREINFNKDWKFYLGNNESAANKNFDDSSWADVDLPHDFSITQHFTSSGEAESGFLPGGTGWYRKTFIMPMEAADQTVLLNFDGVYKDAYVYVNGTAVGEHHYGYSNFAMDITEYLICDGATENVVSVKAVNNLPSSRWYSGSGIYRDVTLVVTDPVHVDLYGTQITTPDIASGSGKVNVEVDVVNDGESEVTATVKNTVYAKGSDSAVATAESDVTVAAGATVTAANAPVVASPALWSTEAPNLYTVKTEIVVGGKVVDTYETDFGFRWFTWSSQGFALNGQNVKLNGVCLHHDQGAAGAAAYYDAMYRQISIMKDMGCNAIRTSHNPADEQFIEICNELGMLVIEEHFDGITQAKNGNGNDFARYFTASVDTRLYGATADMPCSEYVVRSIVKRDRNAPAVFAWSYGNEIQEGNYVNDPAYATYSEKYIQWTSEEDGTRITTIGDNSKASGYSYVNQVLTNILNAGGVVGFNYHCHQANSQTLVNNWGGQWGCILASETSSHTNSRGRYMSQSSNTSIDGAYHLTSYDTSAVGWGDTAHDSMYDTYTKDYIAGEFVWTGFDYIGEPTPWNGTGTGDGGRGAIPNSSYFGIVETTGFAKDNYYLYRAQWNKAETTVHLVTAWDSDNMMNSSSKTPVWVYTNAAKVELYLNDQLIGYTTRTINTTAAGHVYYTYTAASSNSSVCTVSNGSGADSLYSVFNVAYTAGTLTAKAYDESGNEIALDESCGRYTVSTPGAVTKLAVSGNRTTAPADGSSLIYVEVDVTDANGNLDTTASNNITFTVEGPGEIVGVDNGDQATTAKYQNSYVKTSDTEANINAYAGKALVIVRTTEDAGEIRINVASSGLTGGTVVVNTTEVEDGAVATGLQTYTMVRDYSVHEGVVPSLETTATGTMADGSTVNGTIVWDEIPETVYGTVGDHTISGTLTFPELPLVKVTARLHVIPNVIAVRNVSAATLAGQEPVLPGMVKGVLADGTLTGEFTVAWDDVDVSKLANVGDMLTVNGVATILGSETLPVTCTVRVAEGVPGAAKNVGPAAATLTQNVPEEMQSDVLESIIDENTNPGEDTSGRWTNWNNRYNDAQPAITMTWDTAVAVGEVNLYYRYDGSCAKPDAVKFEYSMDNQTFIEVQATETALDATVNNGAAFNYKFDSVVEPVGLRITFTQQGGTANGKCVGLYEAEIMSYPTVLEPNTTADLSGITVDGTAIDGFAADVLNYVVEDGEKVEAATDKNVGITVLPEYNGVIRILTVSEDGSAAKTYAITVGDAPVEWEEENVTLKVGETKTIKIETGNYADQFDDSALNRDVADVKVEGITTTAGKTLSDAVATLEDGTYILVNNRANKPMTNESASIPAGGGTAYGRALSGSLNDKADNAIWTLTKVSDGVYTVQDATGKYLSIANNSASLSDTAVNLDLAYTGSYWTISEDEAYLNDSAEGGTCAAGWKGNGASTDAGSMFRLYKVTVTEDENSTTITIEGKSAGETSFTIGTTRYNIKVTPASEVIDLRNVSTATRIGVVPTLPETVKGVMADGTLVDDFVVTWDTVDAADLVAGTIVTVTGTVAEKNIHGEPMDVTCTIRVADAAPASSSNVGLDATVTQDIPQEYWSDNLASVNDGNTQSEADHQGEFNTHWSNFNYRNISDKATLTFTWDTVQSLKEFYIYFRVDNYSADLPEDVTITYSVDGVEFQEMTHENSQIQEEVEYGGKYSYVLDEPINAKVVNFTLTQQDGYKVESKCVAVYEIQCMTVTAADALILNSFASLSEITADSTAIEGFSSETTKYEIVGDADTVIGAATEVNAGITILPIYEDVVRILTVSEDGTAAKTYEITFTTECTHENTEVRGAVEATCTEPGYTGDTYCTECGELVEKGTETALADHADENADGKCDVCGELLGVIRVAGAGRWQTALLVADEMKAALGDEKFDAIIIASGSGFADALAGSYLATVKNAPILLSYGGDNEKYAYLDNDNINYVKENLAEDGVVYILGGEKAVPTLYEDGLEGYDVVRLGGANRFETNILILEEAGIADGSEVLVCTSANFADSLSASATGKPILLVWNDSGALYGSQPEFLEELKEKNCTFTILGGENAVSAKLADEVAKYGEVDRLAGNTRMETSVLVAEKYFDAPETAVLAYAWNYPDGLCGGSLAYALKAPLILTMPKYEAAAVEYAAENDITTGYVLGGDGLIGDAEVRAIFAMAAADQIVVKN